MTRTATIRPTCPTALTGLLLAGLLLASGCGEPDKPKPDARTPEPPATAVNSNANRPAAASTYVSSYNFTPIWANKATTPEKLFRMLKQAAREGNSDRILELFSDESRSKAIDAQRTALAVLNQTEKTGQAGSAQYLREKERIMKTPIHPIFLEFARTYADPVKMLGDRHAKMAVYTMEDGERRPFNVDLYLIKEDGAWRIDSPAATLALEAEQKAASIPSPR